MYADHFSLANIPFGIASYGDFKKRPATRLGDDVIFLEPLIHEGILDIGPSDVFSALTGREVDTLNSFAALPKSDRSEFRAQLQFALNPENDIPIPSLAVANIGQVTMHLPMQFSEYTDFSCSADHMMNSTKALGMSPDLPPAFLHYPIGYAGRVSSIVASGTPIPRPLGQFHSASEGKVVYGPTQLLDYELEIACIIGNPLPHGERLSAADAEEHIFGIVLLNDWSARDIQALEMKPLGPINSKNFNTSISPWVITLDALEPFRAKMPPRDPSGGPVASYLQGPELGGYDIRVQAEIMPPEAELTPTVLCNSRVDSMYWSFRHLVAHQSVGGCGLRTGDMLASGTISGTADDAHGCLLEQTLGGNAPIEVTSAAGTKEKRVFLKDGDQIRLTGWTVGNDGQPSGVGFGECMGRIVPARM